MTVATVSFPGMDGNMGGEFAFSRGVHPSTCRIWLPAEVATPTVGELVIADGLNGTELRFRDCAMAPHSLRLLKSREGYVWTCHIRDRRWRWRYKRISGEYNRRSCGKLVGTGTSLYDLLLLLGEALEAGEPDLRNVPNVYPYVNWRLSRADVQLAYLCEQFGLVPWLGALDDKFHVDRVGVASQVLPIDDYCHEEFPYGHSIIPSQVTTCANATVYQSALTLRAVAMNEQTGLPILLDDAAYTPADGWSSQWYTTFTGVADTRKRFAFGTVWRWYEIVEPFAGETIELLPYLIEGLGCGLLGPAVFGTFWPLSDLKINVDDEFYKGAFRILDGRVVEFEYPVIQWGSNGDPAAADLKLIAAYRRRLAGEYLTESATTAVPEAVTDNERKERFKYLQRAYVSGTRFLASTFSEDNQTDIQSELSLASQSLAGTYAGGPARDITLEGIRPVDLDGQIAQVTWRCGLLRAPVTRVGINCEPSVNSPDHQQQRRIERGIQVSEEIL